MENKQETIQRLAELIVDSIAAISICTPESRNYEAVLNVVYESADEILKTINK